MALISKTIVGIDFNDHSAQLVELKEQGGKATLECYNRINIPINIINNGEILNEEELKPYLSYLFTKANPKPASRKDIAIVFPSAKVFTHIFDFPGNLDEDELRAALPYKAETVIPFSIDEVYWDFSVINKIQKKGDKVGEQSILFAAITRDVADKYLSVMEYMGYTPSIFGIDVDSLRYGLESQFKPKKSILVIEVGSISTNYLVLKDCHVKHYFSANKGGKDLIEEISKEFNVSEDDLIEEKEKGVLSPKYAEKIMKFITGNYRVGKKIIEEKEKDKDIGAIEEVIITGEYINLPGFYEIAKKEFQDKNISIGDPRKSILVEAKKFTNLIKKGEEKTAYSTYFTNAIGVALRGLKGRSLKTINLLPERLQKQNSIKKKSLLFGITAVVLCLVSVVISSFLFYKYQITNYERLSLEVQKGAIEKMVQGTRYQDIRTSIKQFNKEIEELRGIDNAMFSVPTVLEDIEALISPKITVTGIKFMDSNLLIEIEGISPNREVLLEAVETLKSELYVDSVITPISNFDQKYEIPFKIEVNLIFNLLPDYEPGEEAPS